MNTSFFSPRALALHRWVRAGCVAGLIAGMWVLGGCASQVPAVTFYVLKAEPPEATPVTPMATVPTRAVPWQLVGPVRVPDHLDQDALWLPVGQNGVQPAPNARWAELLSASVPRVLAQDLATLRGPASLWSGPLPAGLVVQGQLRLELLTLAVADAGKAVTLTARWTTQPTGATTQTKTHGVSLRVDSPGTDADSLVGAHRLALWRMAQAVAKSLDDPAAQPRVATPQ